MFDNAQIQIINHTTGHALVLAGAGSGKTSCAVARAAKRILSGLPAKNLFMLTFTNKACNEMRERLQASLPDNGPLPSILTFHKFGYRLIQHAPEMMGRNRNPTLLDDKEPSRRLAEQLKARGFADSDDISRADEYYEKARNLGFTPGAAEHREALEDLLREDPHWPREAQLRALQAMEDYEDWKRRCNLLDFGDLIALPVLALSRPENEPYRSALIQRIQDLTIDESQDNNLSQYKLLRLIAGETVVMIGDDDQSIHRWRGAKPENLHRFIDEFSPTEYRLECNYRSTPNIVNPATAIIRNNRDRLEKNPFAHSTIDIPLEYESHASFDEMANAIALQLRDHIQAGGCPSECAVLYRTNRMARPLEAALIKHALPYQVRQGMDLMHRLEAQMVMAAMRLVINPSDHSALERLIQMVPGAGAKVIGKLIEENPGDPLSATHILKPGKSRTGVERLAAALESLKSSGPASLVAWTTENELFFNWLNNESAKSARQAMRKRPNYTDEDLQTAIQRELEKRNETLAYIGGSLHYRLEQEADSGQEPWIVAMDLIIAPPDEDKDNAERITLSTIHSAKGLQWKNVHVAGMSEGLIPLTHDQRELDDTALVEERCLAYVAMTRAQTHLHLHHPAYVDFPGTKPKFCSPSRFLYEGLIIEKAGLSSLLSNAEPVGSDGGQELSSEGNARGRHVRRIPGLL